MADRRTSRGERKGGQPTKVYFEPSYLAPLEDGTRLGPIIVVTPDGETHQCFAASGNGAFAIRDDPEADIPLYFETETEVEYQEEP